MNDEDASPPLVEQQTTDSVDVHVDHEGMNNNRGVPKKQEDNELTIVNVHMEKDVIHKDGLGRGMIEVERSVKV